MLARWRESDEGAMGVQGQPGIRGHTDPAGYPPDYRSDRPDSRLLSGGRGGDRNTMWNICEYIYHKSISLKYIFLLKYVTVHIQNFNSENFNDHFKFFLGPLLQYCPNYICKYQ